MSRHFSVFSLLSSSPAWVPTSHHTPASMADTGGGHHRAFQARRKCKNLFADCSNTNTGENFREHEQDHQLRSTKLQQSAQHSSGYRLTRVLLCHKHSSRHQKPPYYCDFGENAWKQLLCHEDNAKCTKCTGKGAFYLLELCLHDIRNLAS